MKGNESKNLFSVGTVRRKIILVSKIAGAALIVSYLISIRLPVGTDLSFLIWMCLVVLLVLAVDYLLGKFISKPVSELNRKAKKMADLDFSSPCLIDTNDEFGQLATSLNHMAAKLQKALLGLETANGQLESEVKRGRQLLEERKELVDHLSHEMKTPAGVIRAYAEALQEEKGEAEKQRYLEVIIEETERMGKLVNTLLDLSSLETGAAQLVPERFDFVEFLETVAGRLLIDAPDGCFQLQYELPEGQAFVYTDKARMEQALDNLIVNAKRNVSPGGVLELRLLEESGMLRFSIYNQGTPIPEENLQQVWMKFYRGSQSGYSGSGLGLSIVAQIFAMQGFDYGVENLPDGVRFYFSIPISDS